uniref:Uncharacterized protein n=1 Tax=Tetradesmus obliquus TaxID=3088 RepID=A0A383VP04_TETOB
MPYLQLLAASDGTLWMQMRLNSRGQCGSSGSHKVAAPAEEPAVPAGAAAPAFAQTGSTGGSAAAAAAANAYACKWLAAEQHEELQREGAEFVDCCIRFGLAAAT